MNDLFIIPYKLSTEINFTLLLISIFVMTIICFKLIITKNLLESVIMMSCFSLFIGICYLFMDAPDVAMTETALGACLSTCVLLNLVKIVGNYPEKSPNKLRIIFAIILSLTFIICLTYAAFDLPLYGDPDTLVHTYLTKYYIENTASDIGIPSIVTAILASYRGYDTLGETTVILIAGLGVILISARRSK